MTNLSHERTRTTNNEGRLGTTSNPQALARMTPIPTSDTAPTKQPLLPAVQNGGWPASGSSYPPPSSILFSPHVPTAQTPLSPAMTPTNSLMYPGFPLSFSHQRQRCNAPSSPWLVPCPHPPQDLPINAPLCQHVRLPVLSGYGSTWVSRYGSATAPSQLHLLPDWDCVPWHPDASTRDVTASHANARFTGPSPTTLPPSTIPTAGCMTE